MATGVKEIFPEIEGFILYIICTNGKGTLNNEQKTWLKVPHFAEKMGCEITEFGGIMTDVKGRTSIPGLHAGGDSSNFMPPQLVFAAAAGPRIAMGVNMDLTEEDFR